MVNGRPSLRARPWLAPTLALAGLTVGCGALEDRDIHDAINSRDVGSYIPLGRALFDDGSLAVHVAASEPEHARSIAQHIVRQNYSTAASAVRVIIDPMVGDGDRQVFLWDAHGFNVDTSTVGLPPRAARPRADSAEAPPH